MFNLEILEVTKENKEKYLGQIAQLEQKVLQDMEAKGKVGQLFITGRDDIEQYIESAENTVVIAGDKHHNVEAVAYITQNQMPFTYNDITKYFKYGERYEKYIKSQYSSNQEYQLDMLKAYKMKMMAYKAAREKVLKAHPEYETILEFLEHELSDKENKFHEKSELRNSINQYMSEYIESNFPEEKQLYERFYWTTISDIEKEFGRNINLDNLGNRDIKEYDEFLSGEKPKEHEEILTKGKLKIYSEPQFDIEKYYNANTENAVEIDTYITTPENRKFGLARIVVFEGIKKHIEEHFKNPENQEIFLCSTLHKDNLSSKYVSEFFGLRDNLFVNRRQGRDREVHICKVLRENAREYIEDIENKLIVLYGYNPNNKFISDSQKLSILKEQLQYETDEVNRLKYVTHKRKRRFKAKKSVLRDKRLKVEKLKNDIKNLKTKMHNAEEIDDER